MPNKGGGGGGGNTLYTADCHYVMNGMDSESVDLIYLDPPFNSKRLYSAPIGSDAAGASFKDMWTWEDVDEYCLQGMVENHPFLVDYITSIKVLHGKPMMAYVTYMAQRILQMYRILKDTGSLYLHCDSYASHYLKIILDYVFGKDNFRNEVIWRIGWVSGFKTQKRGWIRNHDTILFYVKTPKAHKGFNKEYIPYPSDYVRRDGKRPTGKGVPIEDTWNCSNADVLDSIMIKSFSKEKTGYPTQKPLALLERIIKASSNEGDLVLDPFCGCATTCVASQRFNRRWVGIDVEEMAVDLVVSRLTDDAGLFKDFKHTHKLPQRADVVKVVVSNKKVKVILYDLQQGKCKGCDNQLEIRHMEIDHIIPRSKGGGDYRDNYQLLCGNCNRIKGNRPMEFLNLIVANRQRHISHRVTFGG